MRYTQLLPLAGAATALATPIVPRKDCAANDDSYDFVRLLAFPANTPYTNTPRLSLAVVQLA
jgi:hypothetical protein